MAQVEFKISHLVNLAIGTPEVGAVNFNLLQKVLMEMLRLTDLESATVGVNAEEAVKINRESLSETLVLRAAEETLPVSEQVPRRSRITHIDSAKIDMILEDLTQLKFDVEDLSGKILAMEAANETVPFQQMTNSLTQVDGIQDRLKRVEEVLAQLKDLDLGEGEERGLGQRLMYLEKNLENHDNMLKNINSILDDQVKDIIDKFEDMQRDLGEVNERMNLTHPSADLSQHAINIDEGQGSHINSLLSRISSLQQELDNVNTSINNIIEEHESKQMFLEALSEQVEALKLVKADKTNMEDILAAKADMSQVHRKVSHDHFEDKIDELNQQMLDAFNRLDAHEDLWQEEVEDLKSDIQNKIDKMEFLPLKDYVNEKLKILQEKMKVIAAQRREGLSAGSKKGILRDVQCISCDNESIMKSVNTMEDMSPTPGLPTQQSIKPFLTYKLDQVRKQQQKLPSGRNLNHFEEMLHDPMAFRTRANKTVSKEHVVTRYVGGSHTITTPIQRVTRMGNFFETWGPVITAVPPTQSQAGKV